MAEEQARVEGEMKKAAEEEKKDGAATDADKLAAEPKLPADLRPEVRRIIEEAAEAKMKARLEAAEKRANEAEKKSADAQAILAGGSSTSPADAKSKAKLEAAEKKVAKAQ